VLRPSGLDRALDFLAVCHLSDEDAR
jgi:hypothetical protein